MRGLSLVAVSGGPLFIAVRGPLSVMASLVGEHRLQMRKLSSCGSRAQLLRGMWDLPRPGLEPVSPALAGRFSTTAPPGKPKIFPFASEMYSCKHYFQRGVLWDHNLRVCCYWLGNQLLTFEKFLTLLVVLLNKVSPWQHSWGWHLLAKRQKFLQVFFITLLISSPAFMEVK